MRFLREKKTLIIGCGVILVTAAVAFGIAKREKTLKVKVING